MENIYTCSNIRGKKTYRNENGGFDEYFCKNAADLHFIVLSQNKDNSRHLILVEKLDEDNFKVKCGYDINVSLQRREDDVPNEFVTDSDRFSIVKSFPFVDVVDIACGYMYTDTVVHDIYNMTSLYVYGGFTDEFLNRTKGVCLSKKRK